MRNHRRTISGVLLGLVCAVLGAGLQRHSLAQQAQGKQAQQQKDRAKKQRHLPHHYNQLQLTPEQEQRIRQIVDQYGEKVDELEKRIVVLKRHREGELVNSLTDAQRQRLGELREEARQKRQQNARERAQQRRT